MSVEYFASKALTCRWGALCSGHEQRSLIQTRPPRNMKCQRGGAPSCRLTRRALPAFSLSSRVSSRLFPPAGQFPPSSPRPLGSIIRTHIKGIREEGGSVCWCGGGRGRSGRHLSKHRQCCPGCYYSCPTAAEATWIGICYRSSRQRFLPNLGNSAQKSDRSFAERN